VTNATTIEGVYVDTCILGAYYCPEALSEKAEETLRKIPGPVISSLSDVEFCSLISRKRRLRELGERQANEILALFDAHVAQGFYRRVSLSVGHFLKARQLVSDAGNGLRTLDSLHLAAAVTESLTLLTADRNLAKIARRVKTGVIFVK
jgi:predicted nucleic acid-binding protein